MAKGTILSEFKKGAIIVLKRVGKSQREIFKALGRYLQLLENSI